MFSSYMYFFVITLSNFLHAYLMYSYATVSGFFMTCGNKSESESESYIHNFTRV